MEGCGLPAFWRDLRSFDEHVTIEAGEVHGSQRAHIVLPSELVDEIDSEVGPGGRSAFVVETVCAELRKRLLVVLRSGEPVWKDENHPELQEGADAWVWKLRRESDARIPEQQDTEADA